MTLTNEPLTTDQLFSRTKQRQQLLIKRQIVVAAIAVLFTALSCFHALNFFETALLDAWLSRSQPAAASNVVLIPISKKSIDQIGSWPWPPFRYAVVIELLKRFGARSIYVDAVFSEVFREDELKPLEEVLKKKGTPVFFAADYLPHFETPGAGLAVLGSSQRSSMAWVRPVAAIRENAFWGHRQTDADQDRVFRVWKPRLEGQGAAYPFVALKMAEEMGAKTNLANQEKQTERFIPWNRAAFESWPRIEFADLLQSYLAMREGMQPTIDPAVFNGSDIFIGLADESGSLSGLTPWHRLIFPYEMIAAVFRGASKSDFGMAPAPAWMGNALFGFAVIFFIVLAGRFNATTFWLSWCGFFLTTGVFWGFALFFKMWLPCAASLLFLLSAGAAIFIFDAIYARQERSALFHLATRDGLTGLYVIRHFRVIMNQMTREARARKESLAVILMDLDHFKMINDTYGHPAGDMVLKKTAETIQTVVRQRRTLRDIDFVARYGGEEFIILIRRNSLEVVASRIAERIREAIEKTKYEWQDEPIRVTASLGVAALGNEENVPDAMVHRADKALYLAKKSGRNRICTEKEIKNS